MKQTLFAALAAIALLTISGPAPADERISDAQFTACIDGMLRGFESGIEERACQGFYDLPSAYHFYCAQRVRTGFKTDLERDACVRFFESQALAAMRAYVRVE